MKEIPLLSRIYLRVFGPEAPTETPEQRSYRLLIEIQKAIYKANPTTVNEYIENIRVITREIKGPNNATVILRTTRKTIPDLQGHELRFEVERWPNGTGEGKFGEQVSFSAIDSERETATAVPGRKTAGRDAWGVPPLEDGQVASICQSILDDVASIAPPPAK